MWLFEHLFFFLFSIILVIFAIIIIIPKNIMRDVLFRIFNTPPTTPYSRITHPKYSTYITLTTN